MRTPLAPKNSIVELGGAFSARKSSASVCGEKELSTSTRKRETTRVAKLLADLTEKCKKWQCRR